MKEDESLLEILKRRMGERIRKEGRFSKEEID